ncbi:hypothetical protein L873DRAFT_1673622 [Choiromyces venosus 120613-1]|uniref:Borealin N-terminal domain-containing protein n=1 Tax=Choiromyces venosus 120613-1 TaxID=1336337 RepID=A0A3N4JZA1_9PEZI|nr:hypothetical protein L873DRAFT_1673622 [Choiromyces venosus 120613-1]
MTPMKSPLRQVRPAGITKNQKATIIENLNLEITERARKLRAQYTMQARSLKQRIEMRINRVPKKLWGMKMGDLLAQHSNKNKEPKAILPKLGPGGVKGFVEDVKRLSNEGNSQLAAQSERLVVPKKRAAKKTAGASAREKMPPPPLPAHPSSGLSLSPGKPSLPPSSSSPVRSSSPARPLPAKKTVGRTARKVPSSGSIASASTRPSSRATTRSSLETIATSAGGSSQEILGAKGTKSSQAKGKAAATTTNTANTGLKRGGVKGNPSSGSLKENKVAGVKEKPSSSKTTKKEAAATTGGRILRSRK